MKQFLSDAYIANLNALHGGGIFFRAAVVELTDTTTLYLADVQDPITFNGHVYTPLQMAWGGMEQTNQQSLPTVTVTVPNIDGVIGSYLEATNILGRTVRLQLIHLALLGETSAVDNMRLTILAVDWTWEHATFHLGLDMALQEVLPKRLITAAEFPGVPEGLRRASIL